MKKIVSIASIKTDKNSEELCKVYYLIFCIIFAIKEILFILRD